MSSDLQSTLERLWGDEILASYILKDVPCKDPYEPVSADRIQGTAIFNYIYHSKNQPFINIAVVHSRPIGPFWGIMKCDVRISSPAGLLLGM